MTSLEQIISDYQNSKQQETNVSEKRLLTCVSLGSDEKTGKVTSCLGARSEEVIPTSAAEAEALLENRDKAQLKKCEWFTFIDMIVGVNIFLGTLYNMYKSSAGVAGVTHTAHINSFCGCLDPQYRYLQANR